MFRGRRPFCKVQFDAPPFLRDLIRELVPDAINVEDVAYAAKAIIFPQSSRLKIDDISGEETHRGDRQKDDKIRARSAKRGHKGTASNSPQGRLRSRNHHLPSTRRRIHSSTFLSILGISE